MGGKSRAEVFTAQKKSHNWGETNRSPCCRQHSMGAEHDRKFTHPLKKKDVRGFIELGYCGLSSTLELERNSCTRIRVLFMMEGWKEPDSSLT